MVASVMPNRAAVLWSTSIWMVRPCSVKLLETCARSGERRSAASSFGTQGVRMARLAAPRMNW